MLNTCQLNSGHAIMIEIIEEGLHGISVTTERETPEGLFLLPSFKVIKFF